jgi:hypothetical protein
MTKQEKIIVSAYTGFLMCDFDDMQKYIEKKLGRPVFTHELPSESVHDACRDDFLALCGDNKSLTNRDHLRELSNDDAAELLILSPEMEFCICRLCEHGNPTPQDDRGQCLNECRACSAEARCEAFKKWLKQPYEGSEDDD